MIACASGMATLRLITFSRPVALLAAEQQGFFHDQGLEVACEITRGSVEQVRGLMAGRWDVAHTAADNVMAYVDREQADLFIFAVADLGLGQKLIVEPSVQGFADLRGRTLGVDALDTGYAFVLRGMLQRNGLGLDDYQLEAIGSTPERWAALREGRVAGCLLSSPSDERAIREGFRLLALAGEYFPVYPGLTAATTRRWAADHDADLLAYTRALLAGAAWAADPANAEKAVDLIARDQQVDAEGARRRLQVELESRSVAQPTDTQVAQGLEVVRDLRRQITGVGGPLESYFDPTYMRRARE